MKIMISIISIIIVLAGVLPFFGSISPIPTTGLGYSIFIICVGIAGMIYGILNNLLMGFEKFVVIIQGILVIFGGILPFISEFVSLPIPTSGPLYSGLIIVIGGIGLVYGFIAMG